MAADSGVRIASHTWSDAVALMANPYVTAAVPHGMAVEVDPDRQSFIDELPAEPLRIDDGLLQLSSARGFGVELNTEVVDRLCVPHGQLTQPGNYSDLIFRGRHGPGGPLARKLERIDKEFEPLIAELHT